MLATFSPAHFEAGDSIFSPIGHSMREEGAVQEYGERAGMGRDSREGGEVIVYEEAEAAKARWKGEDGIMHRDPFAHGAPEKIGSGCLYFCLSGPVDTINEISLQILRNRR